MLLQSLLLGLVLPSAVLPCPVSAFPSQDEHRHGASLARWEEFLKVACELSADSPADAPPFSELFGYGIGPSALPIPSTEQLEKLAAEMDETAARGSATRFDDPSVPSGLIFFGQFIDHDITLDVVSRLGAASDPAEIENVRSPRLDLDSVYMDGPEASPQIYDSNRHGFLLTGTSANPLDLPRNSQGTALIGDPRNDENIVIAQLHLMLLRFHNAVLTDVEAGVFDGHRLETDEGDFEFARRIVRWHYQWIIMHEFLPAVIQESVLAWIQADLKQGGWCATGELPALPIEFSAAAYRFGHSQVRGSLRLRRSEDAVPLFDRNGGLMGFSPVDPAQTIDWSLFFRTSLAHPQPARKLDTFLAAELFDLPFAPLGPDASLASRNLRRGAATFRLSTGEEAHGYFDAHSGGMLGSPLPTHPAVTASGLDGTPLWFYCLYEAEAGGGKLGTVGGTIVGLTLDRMLRQDPLSYLADTSLEEVRSFEARASLFEGKTKEHLAARSFKQSNETAWRPFLGHRKGFSLADMIRYVEASEGH